jgi:hypothetical protein
MGTTRHPRTAQHLRRLVAGFFIAIILTATPAMAQAAFRAIATGSLSTATYAIPTPATIAGTYSCNTNKPYGSTINITSYGKVARATGYLLTVTAPDGTSLSQTITANTASLTAPSTIRNGSFTYELTALVGTWTGTPHRGSYTCGTGGTTAGTL